MRRYDRYRKPEHRLVSRRWRNLPARDGTIYRDFYLAEEITQILAQLGVTHPLPAIGETLVFEFETGNIGRVFAFDTGSETVFSYEILQTSAKKTPKTA